jgi:hypothetical protein
MRNPKPSVTALTPSGTLSRPSRRRPRDRAAATAASPPTVTAIAVAIRAYTIELRIASVGATNRTLPERTLPRAR